MNHIPETSLAGVPNLTRQDFEAGLRDLSSAAFEGEDESAMKALDVYVENHQAALSAVVAGIEGRLSEPQADSIELPFSAGAQINLPYRHGKVETALDLSSLGLPRTSREGVTPLAVIIHGKASGTSPKEVGAIQLIVDDGGRTRSQYLEDISGARGGDESSPHWVDPGRALLSRMTVEVKDVATIPAKNGQSMLTIRSEADRATKDSAAQAWIIRPKPTDTERAATGAEEGRVRAFIRKRARKIGAIAAVSLVATGAAAHNSHEPQHLKKMHTAQEMVLPAGTDEQNGVYQAEEFFDADTLARSRQAFGSYLKGDKAALQAEALAHNYHDNWISPADFAAVQNAASYADLAIAFKKTIKDLPITIDFNAVASANLNPDYTYTPNASIADSKRAVESILKFYNLLDQHDLAKNMRPLQYNLVGEIKGASDNGVHDPDGYFSPAQGLQGAYIVIPTKHNNDYVVAHENGHDYDMSGFGAFPPNKLSSMVAGLNPKGFTYAGYAKASHSKTTIDGNTVTDDQYGNSSDQEDVAMTNETLMTENPTLGTEDSTLFEKQEAILFYMEQSCPGFTASFLSHAKLVSPGTHISTVIHEVSRTSLPYLEGLSFLLLSATAYGFAQNSKTRRARERLGLPDNQDGSIRL